jgi:hypothetical protein
MLQEQLRQYDRHHGLGEVSLARNFIKEAPFSVHDLSALAQVSKATHRGGQVEAIVWVIENVPLDVPNLRQWLTKPSGELDLELVSALGTRLKNTSVPDWVWGLFQAATAPQSV